MDSKLFRLPTNPNFYASAQNSWPVSPSQQNKKQIYPTEDARFPGWAAPLEDGRLVTDYRSHCEVNIAPEKQEVSRVWMQQNADQIMDIARERQAKTTGMIYGVDSSIVPPPEVIVNCTPAECTRTNTNAMEGIGMERAGCPCPPLFGTFEPAITSMSPRPLAPQTSKYEGGRNSLRGRSQTSY
ncbi:MAG: hypothetical protein EBU73_02310 [Chitinophagia bacterium]|nr:hypothetical protein [Chitinophagia bacterium]